MQDIIFSLSSTLWDWTFSFVSKRITGGSMVCERIQLMQILNLVILNYGYTVMSGLNSSLILDYAWSNCWFQKFTSNVLDNQMETQLLSPIYTGVHFSVSMLIPLMPSHLKLPLISSYGVEAFGAVDFNKILCPCMCLLMGDQFPWQQRILWAPSKSKAFFPPNLSVQLFAINGQFLDWSVADWQELLNSGCRGAVETSQPRRLKKIIIIIKKRQNETNVLPINASPCIDLKITTELNYWWRTGRVYQSL